MFQLLKQLLLNLNCVWLSSLPVDILLCFYIIILWNCVFYTTMIEDTSKKAFLPQSVTDGITSKLTPTSTLITSLWNLPDVKLICYTSANNDSIRYKIETWQNKKKLKGKCWQVVWRLFIRRIVYVIRILYCQQRPARQQTLPPMIYINWALFLYEEYISPYFRCV